MHRLHPQTGLNVPRWDLVALNVPSLFEAGDAKPAIPVASSALFERHVYKNAVAMLREKIDPPAAESPLKKISTAWASHATKAAVSIPEAFKPVAQVVSARGSHSAYAILFRELPDIFVSLALRALRESSVMLARDLNVAVDQILDEDDTLDIFRTFMMMGEKIDRMTDLPPGVDGDNMWEKLEELAYRKP